VLRLDAGVTEDLALHALMIFVPDLDEARRFYRDTLGMRLASERGDRLVFTFSNGTLLAFRCDKDGHIGDYANESRSVFVFRVASIAETMATLRAAGVRFLHEEPAENEWGQYAAFADPFGNVHELFEAGFR
jgi:catechol 2,3-dioxygenase-like lactoylglutathione lyase family enzyme